MLSHPGAPASSRFCIIPEKRGHEFRTSSLIHLFIADDFDQPYRLLMALRSQQVRPSDDSIDGDAGGEQKGDDTRRREYPVHWLVQNGRAVNEKKNAARKPAKRNGTG
jgi:hypothetical protein